MHNKVNKATNLNTFSAHVLHWKKQQTLTNFETSGEYQLAKVVKGSFWELIKERMSHFHEWHGGSSGWDFGDCLPTNYGCGMPRADDCGSSSGEGGCGGCGPCGGDWEYRYSPDYYYTGTTLYNLGSRCNSTPNLHCCSGGVTSICPELSARNGVIVCIPGTFLNHFCENEKWPKIKKRYTK